MQLEMEEGGKLFFDLFVAMCNHMVYSLPSLSLTLDYTNVYHRMTSRVPQSHLSLVSLCSIHLEAICTPSHALAYWTIFNLYHTISQLAVLQVSSITLLPKSQHPSYPLIPKINILNVYHIPFLSFFFATFS